LGDVVNVASRVQGATKYLGADCLITGETLNNLPDGLPVRRLARVRCVNIEHAIDLYEIIDLSPSDWDERRLRYADALASLESDELDEAAERAQRLAADFPHDAAAEALCRRILAARHGPTGDTTVWQLPGK
jgi:adenylate cyclase